MAYSTDGALTSYHFVALADDLNAQPIYQPAPVFRGEVIRAYPQIVRILNPIFASLDDATLRGLNVRVETGGEDAEAVARDYLETRNFIKPPDAG
jgi:osmoprotectant transport system substrate-binding protein